MKVAVAQINPTIADIEGNSQKIITTARKAAELGTDLVVFPELSIPGAPATDLLRTASLVDANVEAVTRIAKEIPDIACIVGFADRNPLPDGRPLYSAAAIIEGGDIQYVYYKSIIPSFPGLDQSTLFEPAVGVSLTKYKDKRIAVSLGEDLWTDEGLGRSVGLEKSVLDDVSKRKIELVINVCASPYTVGMERKRIDVLKQQAVKHKVPIVMCNVVGGNDGTIYDGTSVAVSASGEVIARAKSFEEDIIFIDLVYGAGDIHGEDREDADQIHQALVLGVGDYARKSGRSKALVALTGDVDSAVTACVAAEALGKENVHALLMPQGDSDSTQEAQELARGLGIRADVVDIRKLVDTHKETVDRFGPGGPGNLADRVRSNLMTTLAANGEAVVLRNVTKTDRYSGADVSGAGAPLDPLGDLSRTLVQKIAREVINREASVIPPAILDAGGAQPEFDEVVRLYEEGKSLDDIASAGIDKGVAEEAIGKIETGAAQRDRAPEALRITTEIFSRPKQIPVCRKR